MNTLTVMTRTRHSILDLNCYDGGKGIPLIHGPINVAYRLQSDLASQQASIRAATVS